MSMKATSKENDLQAGYGGLLEGIGPTADELSVSKLGYNLLKKVLPTHKK